MRLALLSDEQLLKIAESEYPYRAGIENILSTGHSGISLFVWNMMRVMAMEIIEFRRAHGGLGCEWLEC